MSEPIGDLVRELCGRLGVPYEGTRIITISPTQVLVSRWHTKVSLIKGRAPYKYLAGPPGWETPVWIEREFEVDTT